MSVKGISDAARRVAADGVVDKKDVQTVLNQAGKSINAKEEKAIRDAFENTLASALTPEAKTFAREALKDLPGLRRYAQQRNDMVEARAPGLAAQEKARLETGQATKTLGGTPIPEDVKKLISAALAAGVEPYDVAEMGTNPTKDDHGEGFTVAGKWTPYPQDIDAVGNMAFSYTEVTPEKLKEDMATDQDYTRIKGYRTETQRDLRTGETHSFQVAEYEKVHGKGTGNITSHYDEASHNDPYARGRSGQKWANNYAILADGSLHALPAVRRNPSNPGLILTNPSLARGQRMLFNGHIEVRGGVVTSIGMSGRIQKMAQEGDARFLNPVPLLKAWGFEISPNLRLNYEGSGPDPKEDPNTHVIG